MNGIFVLKVKLSKSKGAQQSLHPTKSQPMFIYVNMQMNSEWHRKWLFRHLSTQLPDKRENKC